MGLEKWISSDCNSEQEWKIADHQNMVVTDQIY